jgi:hypothetical protein
VGEDEKDFGFCVCVLGSGIDHNRLRRRQHVRWGFFLGVPEQ